MDPELKTLWLRELEQMRLRVAQMRQTVVRVEQETYGTAQLAYLGGQVGMFSLLPLTEAQETALTRDHGIHVVQGGRINVARLGDGDVPWLIRAVRDVTGG